MIASPSRAALAVLIGCAIGPSSAFAEASLKPCRLVLEAEYETLNDDPKGVSETLEELLACAGYRAADVDEPILKVQLTGTHEWSRQVDYEDTGEIHLDVKVGLKGKLSWQPEGGEAGTAEIGDNCQTHAETTDEQDLLASAYSSSFKDANLPATLGKLIFAGEAERLAFYRQLLGSDSSYLVGDTVTALSELKDPSPAAPELLKALRTSEWVASEIAGLLTQIGGKEVIDTFIEVSTGDGYSDRFEAAVKALVHFPEPRVIDHLVKAKMDYENSYVLERAIKDIGEAAVPRVIEELKNPEHQETAVSQLALIGSRTAVEPLLGLLSSDERMVRWQAVRALGDIGDDRAVEPVLKLARDDAEVRPIALLALSELKAWKAVPEMLDALKDEDVRTRDFAARALAEISGAEHGDDAAAWRTWWESEKDKHPDDSGTD